MHTQTTIIGNLVEDPVMFRFDNEGREPSFKTRLRVAASRRRLRHVKGKEEWFDADKLYITVECWGELACNVRRSMLKGHPVICIGHLVTNHWEDAEKGQRAEVALRANHVAFEVSRHALASKRTDAQEHVPDADLTFADPPEPDRVFQTKPQLEVKKEEVEAPF